MLKPNNDWEWYYESECNSLLLDLGNEYVFRVSIPMKNLVPTAKESSSFSVNDAATFQIFNESLKDLDIVDNRGPEVLLNAIAAVRYHKPLMPKSWFFTDSGVDFSPQQGEVVTMCNDLNCGRFLILENSGAASLCICIEASFELSESKTLHFCETIKVMNDRMSQYQQQSHANNYALVG
ncbi:cell division protein ZapC [Vibrio sp. SS-MA-C1-2]|uniref:cell division protein ZapC n=1 Tax=Vibrio sp. SS-MA-C1-2 TaxID=2908646 RepID=UPI001F1BDA8C|nr:cell division protein ZapC [Vibrio sp. SS-MA-C1-2]UJF18088.1 cell division protein ZapC [Vibrio sp. SS-MA-C1-2]